MRVIAGTARGRRLRSAEGPGVRPTTDRLKESLFATLGPGIRDKRVLDLFAGSGGLGIEALSRGAAHATFVEADAAAVAVIKVNLEATGLADRADVVRRKALAFAEGSRFGGPGEYDVVFADPPYDRGIPAPELEALGSAGRLAAGAMVVVEVSSRLADLNLPAGYRLLDARRYGDSKLLYLKQSSGDG